MRENDVGIIECLVLFACDKYEIRAEWKDREKVSFLDFIRDPQNWRN
jgi:hypothetical protein